MGCQTRIVILLLALAGSAVMAETRTFLALGDSYTIGETVRAEQRWPVQLADRLRERGLDMANPRIIARTGWTTGELQQALNRARPQPGYDLVSLAAGVNNQYRSQSLERFEAEFIALLQQAIGLAQDRPERVLVLSIPDWSRTPFARTVSRQTDQESRSVEQFNRIVAQQAEAHSVQYVDVTGTTMHLAEHPDWVADDGLHPSASQYAHWVDLILSQIEWVDVLD